MAKDFFRIYDKLIQGIEGDGRAERVFGGNYWTGVQSGDSIGMAMTTCGESIPPSLRSPYQGMYLKELAQAAKSWNLMEASCGQAAINAFYNTRERLEQLKAELCFEDFCTRGIDLRGKRIGLVGHLRMPSFVREQAEVFVVERCPRPGDYPDSACEWLLPTCDIVMITGSVLVNKTLPRLLELCENACTILTGPTVPMCPELLGMGIDRLAGLIPTDQAGVWEKIMEGSPGCPYTLGIPFLLEK